MHVTHFEDSNNGATYLCRHVSSIPLSNPPPPPPPPHQAEPLSVYFCRSYLLRNVRLVGVHQPSDVGRNVVGELVPLKTLRGRQDARIDAQNVGKNDTEDERHGKMSATLQARQAGQAGQAAPGVRSRPSTSTIQPTLAFINAKRHLTRRKKNTNMTSSSLAQPNHTHERLVLDFAIYCCCEQKKHNTFNFPELSK